MKKRLLVLVTVLFATVAYSQTEEELKSEKAQKKDSIAAIQ